MGRQMTLAEFGCAMSEGAYDFTSWVQLKYRGVSYNYHDGTGTLLLGYKGARVTLKVVAVEVRE